MSKPTLIQHIFPHQSYTDYDSKPVPELIPIMHGKTNTIDVDGEIWWGPAWTHFNEKYPNLRRVLLEYREVPYVFVNKPPNHVKYSLSDTRKCNYILDVSHIWCNNTYHDLVYGLGYPCDGMCCFENCKGNIQHSFMINFDGVNNYIEYLDVYENISEKIKQKIEKRFASIVTKPIGPRVL